ncbi:M16 family metallopeptidase [Mesonia aestuariivivens]|nr:M16 family metallopeptidase [Mesonia aestuariivivens]
MNFNHILGLFLCTLFAGLPVQSQTDLDHIPGLRYGKLPNGLRYFIKDIDEPTAQTTMRLYLNVGAHHQDSSQLELAHFTEHMAFKPTKHIPKSIKDEAQLQRLGMNIRDISGTTSNQYTRYDFNIPTHNMQAFEMGLRWFRDIATNLQLTDRYINQERGSVLQEYLMGNQENWAYFKAQKNLEAKMFPFRSSFDDFLTHIKHFSPQDLKRFYKKWYRPDLMNVMIVGNIEAPAEIEKRIKAVFRGLPKPNTSYPVVDIHQAHQSCAPEFKVQQWDNGFKTTKKEDASFFWYIRQPQLVNRLHTKEGFQDYVAFQLISQILSKRYLEMEMESPLFSAHIGAKDTYTYGGNPFSLELSFTAPIAQREQAFGLMVQKILQLKRDGVYQNELEKVKKIYLSEIPIAKQVYWNGELFNYALKNEMLFPYRKEGLLTWIQELSVEELNVYCTEFLSSLPQDIGIIAPKGSKALQYSEEEVRQWIVEAYKQPVEAYQAPKIIEELYTKKEKEHLKEVTYTKVKPTIPDTEEFILANGLRIIMKAFQPSAGVEANSLTIQGWTTKGASCFPDQDYYSALNAPSLVHYKAIKGFSKRELDRFKENNGILNSNAYIDYYESSVQVKGDLSSAEELVQIISLYFQPVHIENATVEAWKEETLAARSEEKSLQADFQNAIRHSVEDRAIPPLFNFRSLKGKEALEGILKTNAQKSYQIYNQLFSSPQDWTFLITGNMAIQEIIPLVQTYLGNIPQKETKQSDCSSIHHSPGFSFQGPKKQTVYSATPMENVMYQASYYRGHSNTKNRWKETLNLEVFSELTEIMLKRLRHEKGFSIYNYGTYGHYNFDEQRHQFSFLITCQPDELIPIQKEIGLIIKELKQGKITREYFLRAKEKISMKYASDNLRKHRTMQQLLFEHLRYEQDWKNLNLYQNFINTLTVEDMISMANTYFQDNNKVEVIMRGEERL